MATDVKIPTLGESISSGILTTWHVKNGAVVEAGQSLFDLETDKITSEAVAEVAGRVEILAQEGDEVAVGAVVARIHETDTAAAASPTETPTAAPTTASVPAAPTTADAVHPPSVRRLAAESGIDPQSVAGTGKAGRVTKGDMLSAIEAKAVAAPAPISASAAQQAQDKQPTAPTAPAAATSGRSSRRKMTPLRRTIAQRLVQAQQTTAMLTTFNEADMSTVMQLRKSHQDAFVARHGVKLGFMSFFVKAVVSALRETPGVNAMIDGDEIVQHSYYDIGVAVSTPKGLMVPVIRDCDRKSFAEIEQDILHYAAKARDGKITLEDLQGGVFTITNGGIFGSMLSTPILNTPQSGILGMHAIQERPVAVNGQVVIRPMMYLALSYDHRLVDGREAVTFLVAVKKAIEDPNRLLFEI